MIERAGLGRRPSLRRRLVATVSIPMLALLLLGGATIYRSVLAVDDTEHDRALVDDARAIVSLIQTRGTTQALTPEARQLLAYEAEGNSYFHVSSARHGLLGSTAQYPAPVPAAADGMPVLYDASVGTLPVRAVTIGFHPDAEPEDEVRVTVAETLQGRERLAKDVLALALALLGVLVVGLLLLTWAGIRLGLRSLQPLVDSLRAREGERIRDLDPITDDSVPQEILPLTLTIDGLFQRLRQALEVQEHFVADAAHQLRTPLAGLQLHAEQALASEDPTRIRAALSQIAALTTRVARTSHQLLSLTRAQAAPESGAARVPVDLAALTVETISRRVPDGLRAGVDIGYSGPRGNVLVEGNPPALRDILDNLIDNAILYTGEGHAVTVMVEALETGGARLSVEDDGPGVPEAFLHRLGERFFRVPSGGPDGSGLGLAIVRRIAEQHGASLNFGRAAAGGLQVTITLPPPLKVDST